MDLRKRVEYRARRLVKLDRASHVQRPVQRVFRAAEIAEADADLPQRCQRDREAVAGPRRLSSDDAALRERQRLFVTMLQHHHVRLVAAHRRQHVVGLDDGCQALGLAERRHRLVVASELGERDARERVHEREMAPVAGRVEGRRGLPDVLADDRDVADLAIALTELVMREADPARVVRRFGLLQRASVHRDGARLIATRGGEAPVQAPERGEPAGRHGVAEGVGRAAQRGGGLVEVVLQQRRFGEHRAHRQLFVARERGRPEQRAPASGRSAAPRPRSSEAPARVRSACTEEEGTARV